MSIWTFPPFHMPFLDDWASEKSKLGQGHTAIVGQGHTAIVEDVWGWCQDYTELGQILVIVQPDWAQIRPCIHLRWNSISF